MVYMFLKRYVVGPLVNVAFRPEVRGLHHVPAEGPAILASNHLSVSDSVFMPVAVPRQVFFLAKADYFNGPGLKGRVTSAFFRAINQIPMDRSGGRASARSLSAGGRKLQEGQLLGIYPEGTRSPDGRLYKGKIGVARLALESGAPVVPIAMVGTDKVQPIGARMPLPRRKARVATVFGEPLDFSRYQGRQGEHALLREVTDEIMHAIQALSGQVYVDVYAADQKRRLAEQKRHETKQAAVELVGSAKDKARSAAHTAAQSAKHAADNLTHRDRPQDQDSARADDAVPTTEP
ncbi:MULTISPECIES: lysophospholipid acyltransferase family protein [Kocuria]|jgi:1-acyl-sn-glycerol-3-phosphate acyltransferase|uniref:lysophospholipid acyltransferase family protein n=1 Tax=Kocuria TaxID=57493 RepID=UPI00203CE083|nr:MULTISPECIES: lysophospholipid acyltransferase family protein [Kocuria]MCM3688382.1 1-acyl-sn-glycerol-3-phosphate acyltransferase [Kocuria rosea]HST72717.1 lysophospholipid acyltransferase family protein [Kocuria rosea]